MTVTCSTDVERPFSRTGHGVIGATGSSGRGEHPVYF